MLCVCLFMKKQLMRKASPPNENELIKKAEFLGKFLCFRDWTSVSRADVSQSRLIFLISSPRLVTGFFFWKKDERAQETKYFGFLFVRVERDKNEKLVSPLFLLSSHILHITTL